MHKKQMFKPIDKKICTIFLLKQFVYLDLDLCIIPTNDYFHNFLSGCLKETSQ